ncbi:MAG: alpha/beta fold hydrolase, partial [Antricoccus sp.]
MANSMKSVGTGDHHVICLHGWFGSADGWGYLPELVDTKTFTYHFPEMRGYGARASEAGDYTMREYATDALAAADDAGLKGFSLVGHSMGGKVAASMMMQAPEKIRSLVGISPVAPAPVPLDADSEALFFGAAQAPENRKMILDITTGSRYSDRWLSSMMQHSLDNSTVPAFSGA